jgi:hypothetical protein
MKGRQARFQRGFGPESSLIIVLTLGWLMREKPIGVGRKA